MLSDFPKQAIFGWLVSILWVMTPRNSHGLWPTGDLWVIPPIPTPDGPKSMGYQVLWVTRTYGLRGLRLYRLEGSSIVKTQVLNVHPRVVTLPGVEPRASTVGLCCLYVSGSAVNQDELLWAPSVDIHWQRQLIAH